MAIEFGVTPLFGGDVGPLDDVIIGYYARMPSGACSSAFSTERAAQRYYDQELTRDKFKAITRGTPFSDAIPLLIGEIISKIWNFEDEFYLTLENGQEVCFSRNDYLIRDRNHIELHPALKLERVVGNTLVFKNERRVEIYAPGGFKFM